MRGWVNVVVMCLALMCHSGTEDDLIVLFPCNQIKCLHQALEMSLYETRRLHAGTMPFEYSAILIGSSLFYGRILLCANQSHFPA